MKFLSYFILKVKALFTNGKIKTDVELAIKYTEKSYPYIKMASDIVYGKIDAVDVQTYSKIRDTFPGLFKSILTKNEVDAIALGVAAFLLKDKFPFLSSSIAYLATQLGYLDMKSKGLQPKLLPLAVNGIILKSTPQKKNPLSI